MYTDNSPVDALQTHFPSFSPTLARLSRILFDTRFAALAVQQALTVSSIPAHHCRFEIPARLHVGCPSGEIALVLDLKRHPALESAALASNGDLRTALLGVLLKRLLQHMSIAALAVLKVSLLEFIELEDGGIDNGLAIQVEGHDREETFLITAIDAGVLDALEQEVHATAVSKTLPYFLATLRMPCQVRIASRLCTPALLSSLRSGDVLLNWQVSGDSVGLDLLNGVNLYWGAPRGLQYFSQARIEGSVIIIETEPTMNIDEGDLAHQRHTNPDCGAVNIAALELPVSLEIVTMVLPLEQIGALQPGHVLEMPLAVKDMQIRLMSYGQTLGFGQLVRVGEHLGLQISQMANKNESDT